MKQDNLKYILKNKISYAGNIVDKIINFTFVKPITREIMDYKIKHYHFKNMYDGYGAVEDWDTSKITDMSNLFKFRRKFNNDISNWDVSNVTNMEYMFFECNKFNKNKWNVSSIKNMEKMFLIVINLINH